LETRAYHSSACIIPHLERERHAETFDVCGNRFPANRPRHWPQRRTKYTQARATKFPKWNNAFVMMRNGYFTPLTMKFTDWRSVLGDDYYSILMSREAGV